MWTDLFQRTTRRSTKPGVERVERVDGARRAVSAPEAGEATARTSVVAKRVDCVDAPKVDTLNTPLATTPPTVASAAPNVPPESPPARTDKALISSTPSTPSTPGKHCRVLAAAEKNALLTRFELDTTRAEMQAPVACSYTAKELRRTINLAWRLITVERLEFDIAMAKAAAWVVAQPMHGDEHFFADVLTFSMEAE